MNVSQYRTRCVGASSDAAGLGPWSGAVGRRRADPVSFENAGKHLINGDVIELVTVREDELDD